MLGTCNDYTWRGSGRLIQSECQCFPKGIRPHQTARVTDLISVPCVFHQTMVFRPETPLFAARRSRALPVDKDYRYRINTASITNRVDYCDVRAISYLEVIAKIIRLGGQPQHRVVRRYLLRHALVKSCHFLGLYRNNVSDKLAIRRRFWEMVSCSALFRGISNFSDLCFYLKLWLRMQSWN